MEAYNDGHGRRGKPSRVPRAFGSSWRGCRLTTPRSSCADDKLPGLMRPMRHSGSDAARPRTGSGTSSGPEDGAGSRLPPRRRRSPTLFIHHRRAHCPIPPRSRIQTPRPDQAWRPRRSPGRRWPATEDYGCKRTPARDDATKEPAADTIRAWQCDPAIRRRGAFSHLQRDHRPLRVPSRGLPR